MDPDRIARTVALMQPGEVPEILRALDLFARCGIMTSDVAEEWREAVRARLAELSEPIASA